MFYVAWLKGQISELELHTIRARLTAGIVQQGLRRGELAGSCCRQDSCGSTVAEVVLHPDREVHDRVHLVFATLLEKKSLAQTVRYFDQPRLGGVPRPERPLATSCGDGPRCLTWGRSLRIRPTPARSSMGRTRTRPRKTQR